MASVGVSPSTAVAVKVTGEPWRPDTDAVAVCWPGVFPSIRIEEARPSAPVSTTSGDTPPAPSASHWTDTPSTGSPASSVTTTMSGFGSGSLTGATWPSPPAFAITEAVGRGPIFSPPHCTDAEESSTANAARPSLRDRKPDRVEIVGILAGIYTRVYARFGPRCGPTCPCMSLLCYDLPVSEPGRVLRPRHRQGGVGRQVAADSSGGPAARATWSGLTLAGSNRLAEASILSMVSSNSALAPRWNRSGLIRATTNARR